MLTNTVMSVVMAGAMTLLCKDPGGWKFETSVVSPEKDVEVVRIRLVSEIEAVPPKFSVGWNLKANGVANLWSSADECRLPPDWAGPSSSTMKPEHKAMVSHWLKFTREHRETLLKGRFTPHQPTFRYPVLEAESAAERIVAVYSPTAVADLRRSTKKTIVINATTETGVAVRGGAGLRWTVFNMYGSPVSGRSPEDIPPAGYATAENFKGRTPVVGL